MNPIILMLVMVVFFLLLFNIIFYNRLMSYKKVDNLIEKFVGDDLKLNTETSSVNPLIINDEFIMKPPIKNLVFTLIDDTHNMFLDGNIKYIDKSTQKTHNFDIMAVYTGDNDDIFEKYKKNVEYAFKRKGSKFQNLYYFYNNNSKIFNKYQRFLIIDYDIEIDYQDIDILFDFSNKFRLWICSPVVKNNQHNTTSSITKNKPVPVYTKKINITKQSSSKLTYTNFISLEAPIFNMYALGRFMEKYDTLLIRKGIDYFYMWACGKNHRDKYAIINIIEVEKHLADIQYHLKNKVLNDEINWKKIRKKYNISECKTINYT